MLTCPKCSREYQDSSKKICRECGAILVSTASSLPSEEDQCMVDPMETLPEESVDNSPEDAPVKPPQSDNESVRQTSSQCLKCKETLEANFDLC
jgi:hypothetical protein